MWRPELGAPVQRVEVIGPRLRSLAPEEVGLVAIEAPIRRARALGCLGRDPRDGGPIAQDDVARAAREVVRVRQVAQHVGRDPARNDSAAEQSEADVIERLRIDGRHAPRGCGTDAA